MDWAEELKMTIRKTTARKGRRSKSRDVLKDEAASSSTQAANLPNKDISIDITLDLNNSSSNSATASSSVDTEVKRPPFRRISGGWADAGLKSLKLKKGSFDDERFQLNKSATSTIATDDIPVIPDLDEARDDLFNNELPQPSSASLGHAAVTQKDRNAEILDRKVFQGLKSLNLSMLTEFLEPKETLDEPDELWEWDKLFTEITAEINSEKASGVGIPQKIEIGPDEIPPTVYHT